MEELTKPYYSPCCTKPISPGHPSSTYAQHLVEVMILWPLVVQQEGFPEKQNIHGQPNELSQSDKGREKTKVRKETSPVDETTSIVSGHRPSNTISISNC
jgi:hypothetical protein